MINRRQFLQSMLATSAVAAIPGIPLVAYGESLYLPLPSLRRSLKEVFKPGHILTVVSNSHYDRNSLALALALVAAKPNGFTKSWFQKQMKTIGSEDTQNPRLDVFIVNTRHGEVIRRQCYTANPLDSDDFKAYGITAMHADYFCRKFRRDMQEHEDFTCVLSVHGNVPTMDYSGEHPRENAFTDREFLPRIAPVWAAYGSDAVVQMKPVTSTTSRAVVVKSRYGPSYHKYESPLIDFQSILMPHEIG